MSVATSEAALPHTLTRTASKDHRIPSIDIIRGVVMLLMALDHARVFFSAEQLGPAMSAGLFTTRWITNFCAPAFVFLTGISIYLRQQRYGQPKAISAYLVTRGIWLIFLELTFLRVAWTFNFGVTEYNLANVIWAIGWSMIVMACLIRLPKVVIAVLGGAIVLGHNLIPLVFGSEGTHSDLGRILYWGGSLNVGDLPLIVLYSIMPWCGVMAVGYVLGAMMTRAQGRARRLVMIGLAVTGAFVILRATNVYGNPVAFVPRESLLRSVFAFIDTAKYPASLQFLLMTIGPTFVALGLAENRNNAWTRVLQTYGRAPFLFYLLHIPLIHFLAVLTSWAVHGHVARWFFANHPMAAGPPPDGYAYSLAVVWLIATIASVILYMPCVWLARKRGPAAPRWVSFL